MSTRRIPLPPETGDEAADVAAFEAWELACERLAHPARFGPDGARLLAYVNRADAGRDTEHGRLTVADTYTAPGRPFTYFLGAPEVAWINRSPVPVCVSVNRLARLRRHYDDWEYLPRNWDVLIDSGAYTALTRRPAGSPWWLSPEEYGETVLRFLHGIGAPDPVRSPTILVAAQDLPCEAECLAATGMTVDEHVDATVDNYLRLAEEYPWVTWVPTLQGWEPEQYLRCERRYLDRGVDLAALPRVGIGSICTRGDVPGIAEVVELFAARGYQLHGWGVKTTALPVIGHLLRSADSMAWSRNARHGERLDEQCPHTGDCRNCMRYALAWREKVLDTLPMSTVETVREVVAVTAALTRDIAEALAPGTVIKCPRMGCGRRAKIRRDGMIGAHKMYGAQTCDLVGERPPAGVTVLDLPAGAAPAMDLSVLDEVFGALVADLAPAATATAEEKVLTKVAARVPADAVDWAGPDGPQVLLRWVAAGTYGRVTGLDRQRNEVTVTGYVVTATGLRGGYGGWHPDSMMAVDLDTGAGLITDVYTEMDGRIAVLEPPAGMRAGEPAPWLRMAEELQVLAAREALGMDVEVVDGEHNELWAVDGQPPVVLSRAMNYLMTGDVFARTCRPRPEFRARLVDEALAAGRITQPPPSVVFTPPAAPVFQPFPRPTESEEFLRQVATGKLVDVAGRPLDLGPCQYGCGELAMLSVTCFRAVPCPTCQAEVGRPCVRPSEHRLADNFGGTHATRTQAVRALDERRALAGDWSLPAPWPMDDAPDAVNGGPALVWLLDQVDRRKAPPAERDKALAAAARYANGVPLVHRSHVSVVGWTFQCPVPGCGLRHEGETSAGGCRAAWLRHAGEHAGFVARWDDERYPTGDADGLAGFLAAVEVYANGRP